ncbi:MAG: winged helix-turn-helix domain-containing protein [Methanobacteriaceae archaeon]|jgi:transposase
MSQKRLSVVKEHSSLKKFGVDYSLSQIRRILKSMGMKYGKLKKKPGKIATYVKTKSIGF